MQILRVHYLPKDPARDGIDWYAYCNNPVRFVDPNGLRGKDNSTNYYSEEKVNKLTKKYNSFVKKARKVGYDESANLLEHFLQGSGETYFISSDWLLQYSQVTDAVTINLERYENQFRNIAKNMYPGEVMQLNELPFIEKEQIGPFGKSDQSGFASQQTADVRGRLRGTGNDLYYTTGTFTITTFCDVIITKNLKGEVSVIGEMTHIFWDKYDWHDNLSVYIPTVGKVKDSDAKYLEKYGSAQSFKMKSQWSEDYEKKF